MFRLDTLVILRGTVKQDAKRCFHNHRIKILTNPNFAKINQDCFNIAGKSDGSLSYLELTKLLFGGAKFVIFLLDYGVLQMELFVLELKLFLSLSEFFTLLL